MYRNKNEYEVFALVINKNAILISITQKTCHSNMNSKVKCSGLETPD